MKVYVTTPIHDIPFELGVADMFTMLDMHGHWRQNTDQNITIRPTPDGRDVAIFVNPNNLEWSRMNAASFLLVNTASGQRVPILLS